MGVLKEIRESECIESGRVSYWETASLRLLRALWLLISCRNNRPLSAGMKARSADSRGWASSGYGLLLPIGTPHAHHPALFLLAECPPPLPPACPECPLILDPSFVPSPSSMWPITSATWNVLSLPPSPLHTSSYVQLYSPSVERATHILLESLPFQAVGRVHWHTAGS